MIALMIDRKYIYPSKDGYKVDIRKSKKRLVEKFSSRMHGGDQKALIAARLWRDEVHLEVFGYPVDQAQRYGGKRKGSAESFQGLDLPPRVSVGFHKGEPYYFVVTTPSGKTRFSIASLGLEEAHRRACELASRLP